MFLILRIYKNHIACIKKKNKGKGCTLSLPPRKAIKTINIGIEHAGEILSTIRFTDDIVVMADSGE